jgi:cytochrome c2
MLLAVLAAGCMRSAEDAEQLTGGNVQAGKRLIKEYGCGGCHVIPGIISAVGNVGPSLTSVGGRVYIGGVLTNTPENMVRWLINPPAVDDKTAMPNVGLSEGQARNVAAYLYTLK